MLPKSDSLQLTKTPGGILIRAGLILILLIGLIEGVLRFIQPDILPRSVGSNQYQLEIKLLKLEAFIEEYSGVDILIIGSSVTNTGFIPEEIQDAIYQETGQTLRIFNFGVEGFTINLNNQIIEYIVNKYQPKVILLGSEIRDFSDKTAIGTTKRVMSSEWIQHIGGETDLTGWLAENSLTMQYYLALRNWTREDYLTQRAKYLLRESKTLLDGYEADKGVVYLTPPDPNNPDHVEVLNIFAGFTISPERLDALESFLEIGIGHDIPIIIVEFPTAPEFFLFFGGGENDHLLYTQTLQSTTEANQGYFIPALPPENIPYNGRSDYSHINERGAIVFSRYVGEALVSILSDLEISFMDEGP